MRVMTAEYEPTLYDVIEMMQKMEIRLSAQMESLDSKFDHTFGLLVTRMDNSDERLTRLEKLVNKLVLRVEDIWDILTGANAIVKNHEKRIKKLETRIA